MALLDLRQRTGYLFLAVVVGHIIAISAQVNTRRGVPLLEEVTFGAFAEVQRAVSGAIGGLRQSWEGYFALRQVTRENEQLKQQLADLRVRLQQERATAQQSRTLEALLELRSSIDVSTTAASVIAGGASPDFRTMTIDKGTRNGLRSDMAVIVPSGVVGRVIMPGALASKIQLLIDRNAAAGVIDERSRAQGVVVGTGTSRLRMDYVPSSADVRVGDTIVTSGIDGIYPKGFVVGQIESMLRGVGEYSTITVRPAVDFSTLEVVLVVLTTPGADAATAPEQVSQGSE